MLPELANGGEDEFCTLRINKLFINQYEASPPGSTLILPCGRMQGARRNKRLATEGAVKNTVLDDNMMSMIIEYMPCLSAT